MDIITIHPDKLPDYENKVKMFYEEHLHLDDEIRYILDGSSYFDVRGKDDRWIRIAVSKGDLITLPAGIYHRFTVDESNYTKAMRLFVGEPVWKAYNRPADDFDIRKAYVNSLSCSWDAWWDWFSCALHQWWSGESNSAVPLTNTLERVTIMSTTSKKIITNDKHMRFLIVMTMNCSPGRMCGWWLFNRLKFCTINSCK